MTSVDPDERDRLIEHAHDEHYQGMREAAAFLYGRAAATDPGPTRVALWFAAEEIEKMAKDLREAIREATDG